MYIASIREFWNTHRKTLNLNGIMHESLTEYIYWMKKFSFIGNTNQELLHSLFDDDRGKRTFERCNTYIQQNSILSLPWEGKFNVEKVTETYFVIKWRERFLNEYSFGEALWKFEKHKIHCHCLPNTYKRRKIRPYKTIYKLIHMDVQHFNSTESIHSQSCKHLCLFEFLNHLFRKWNKKYFTVKIARTLDKIYIYMYSPVHHFSTRKEKMEKISS